MTKLQHVGNSTEHLRAAIHWHLIRLTPGHATMLDWFSIGRKLYHGIQQVDVFTAGCVARVCVCALQIDPLMKCLFAPPESGDECPGYSSAIAGGALQWS